ncbi:hypothetical protein NW767_010219 [Fusarium falciforme]|nr:hypothetical protein NW767_010219 [Fusarium falciforme]KAJ4247928.1 hypothetical protein NW757_008552 [Fusarium falciforme]
MTSQIQMLAAASPINSGNTTQANNAERFARLAWLFHDPIRSHPAVPPHGSWHICSFNPKQSPDTNHICQCLPQTPVVEKVFASCLGNPAIKDPLSLLFG